MRKYGLGARRGVGVRLPGGEHELPHRPDRNSAPGRSRGSRHAGFPSTTMRRWRLPSSPYWTIRPHANRWWKGVCGSAPSKPRSVMGVLFPLPMSRMRPLDSPRRCTINFKDPTEILNHSGQARNMTESVTAQEVLAKEDPTCGCCCPVHRSHDRSRCSSVGW